MQFRSESFPPPGGVFVILQLLKMRLDSITSMAGVGKMEPIQTGICVCTGHDRNNITVFKAMAERHDAPIYLCAHTMESNIRVNTERKVNRGAACRQVNDIAARGKDKNLVAEELAAHFSQELAGIA